MSKNTVIYKEDTNCMSLLEEIPYSADADKTQFNDETNFLVKCPEKLCALCNLGENSQLGQGELIRIEFSQIDEDLIVKNEIPEIQMDCVKDESSLYLNQRRPKSFCKRSSDYIDEIDKVGRINITESAKLSDLNFFYIHRFCALWSFEIQRDASGSFTKASFVVTQSLNRRCSYCNHYGASVACKMACPKFYHLPCISASGGFQVIENFTAFCKSHLSQVLNICEYNVMTCRHCSSIGNMEDLIMCTICGDHYHSLCIGVYNLPGVRAGWQCKSCRKCQMCRMPDNNDGKALLCEYCHKIYHAHCIRPIMSSIPKVGWKCKRCRVCSDCGSKTPGAGTSSRWHSHYTICDSCYQQRNKGFSCPICHRAYRAASYKEMVKCISCQKFVHSTCDSGADLSVYHATKETNPDYDYICPPCKNVNQCDYMTMQREKSQDEDLPLESSEMNLSSSADQMLCERNINFSHGKGKPYTAVKIIRKRFGFSGFNRSRDNKLILKKKSRFVDFGRKRGQKSKLKNVFECPGLSLQRPILDSSKVGNMLDEDPTTENKLVLCSAKDKFILCQDLCVMCGSLGADDESCLIACAQCGQCYHPYCVNVKITQVILEKGWRCLDCTVCEGCGQKNDESRLILCDECDISFHIYCIVPPLEYVPQGNWKCKWCTLCKTCGGNSPGTNSTWKNSYTECGPCASEYECAICSHNYEKDELIIQCHNCNRWLHCKCDSIENEESAEKHSSSNYNCPLCRSSDSEPLHLHFNRSALMISGAEYKKNIASIDSNLNSTLDISHYMDGVCLSDEGYCMMKSLQTEIKKRRKLKTGTDVQGKSSGVLAAIESVVSGTLCDNSFEEIKPDDEVEIYKDGMIWENSNLNPPTGFALATNENGIVFLRKKRQRNLQKLGIGGFNVRNRSIKKEGYSREEQDDFFELFPFIENDKKRKSKKKFPKSKLCDAYPDYLQEAFFGKNLLDIKLQNFESDSTDDEKKSLCSQQVFSQTDISRSEDNILPENIIYSIQTEAYNNSNIVLTAKATNDSYALSNINTCTIDIENNLPANYFESKSPGNVNMNCFHISDTNLNNADDKIAEEYLQGTKEKSNEAHQKVDISKENDKSIAIINNSTCKVDSFKNILHNKYYNYDIVKTYSNEKHEAVADKIGGLHDKICFAKTVHTHELLESSKDKIINTFYTENQLGVCSADKIPILSDNYVNKEKDEKAAKPQVLLNTALKRDNKVPDSNAKVLKPTDRMRIDEDLGKMATISAVLYANMCHPNLIIDFPVWSDRCKQIYKLWRGLSNENKALYLQKSKDNRSALRTKKNQQIHQNLNIQKKRDKSIIMQKDAENDDFKKTIDGKERAGDNSSLFSTWDSKETILSTHELNESPLNNEQLQTFSNSSEVIQNISNDIKNVLTEGNHINDVSEIFENFPDEDEFELLRSLTTEIGDDFNLLKYTDSEMELVDPTSNIPTKYLTANGDDRPYSLKVTTGDSNFNNSNILKQDTNNLSTSLKPPPPYPGPPPPYPVNKDQRNIVGITQSDSIKFWSDCKNSVAENEWNTNLKVEKPPGVRLLTYGERINKPMVNLNIPSAPPIPQIYILTEEDRKTQVVYERWLYYVQMQLDKHAKYYEDEIMKIKKTKRTLNGKKRTIKKNGGELTDISSEHAAASSNQALLQKKLEFVRKNYRNHTILIENYKLKYKKKDIECNNVNEDKIPLSSKTHHYNNPDPETLSKQDTLDDKYEGSSRDTQITDAYSESSAPFNDLFKTENFTNLSLNHLNTDTLGEKIPTKNMDENNQNSIVSSSSSYMEQYIPITQHFARYGKIKIGLFGGSPMHKNSGKISCDNTSTIHLEPTNSPKPTDFNVPKDGNLDHPINFKETTDLLNAGLNEENSKASEVSLNSVANQADIEDMSVMKGCISSELPDINSSPLESAVVDDYALFASDVVDYVDNDDSLKHTYNSKCYNINPILTDSLELSTSKSHNIFNTEGSVSWKVQGSKETYKMMSSQLMAFKPVSSHPDNSKLITTSTHTSKPQSTLVMASKKNISDVTQTTAKVSIGNTTISVPILKPVTINSTHVVPTLSTAMISNSINIAKQPAIYVRGQKITPTGRVSLIKPTTNAKIVQATVIGKKIQLPQSSSESTSPASKQNMNYTFLYPKMTQIAHDISLPNKLFEDEPASPYSSTPAQFECDLDSTETKNSINNIRTSRKIIIKKIPSLNKDFVVQNIKPSLSYNVSSDVNTTNVDYVSNKVQLSPLSKPTEMTSNMTNVSEELRTLISAINTSKTNIKNDTDTICTKNTSFKIDTKCTSLLNTENDGEKLNDDEANKKALDTAQLVELKRSKSTGEHESNSPTILKTSKLYNSDIKCFKSIPKNSTELNEQYSEVSLLKNEDNMSKNTSFRSDETQNVLLKQLLQSTNSAPTEQGSSLTQQILPGRKAGVRAPSLGLVSSLEAQLARPVIPPVPASNSIILTTTKNENTQKSTTIIENASLKNKNTIVSKETSFVSNPELTPSLEMDKKSEMPDDDIQNVSVEAENYKIKRDDTATLLPSPLTKFNDQNEHPSKNTYSNSKDGYLDNDISKQKLEIETENYNAKLNDTYSEDTRKKRKRDYQKHRRQVVNKDHIRLKKKSKRNLQVDEDYDSFIDNLVLQIRQLLPLQVLEPLLNRNYGLCSMFGSNDLSDPHGKDHMNLYGNYGNITNDTILNYYESKPFGQNVHTSKSNCNDTIQNGFYDQEFEHFGDFNQWNPSREMNDIFKDKNVETAESIVLSSSPEPIIQLISPTYSCISLPVDDVYTKKLESERSRSPNITYISPTSNRVRIGLNITKMSHQSSRSKYINNMNVKRQNSKDVDANVSVTLTLTSAAAENIIGVLRALASLLCVPSPGSYKIVHQPSTHNFQKNCNKKVKTRCKSSRASLDIQTILNGSLKFCSHCDIVIVNSAINAKINKVWLQTNDQRSAEELTFCSKMCYGQYKWRPSNTIDDNETFKCTNSSNEDDKRSFQNQNNEKKIISTNFTKDDSKIELRFKHFNPKNIRIANEKRFTNREVTDLLFKMGITISAPHSKTFNDTRQCIFCNIHGDGVSDGPSRLLNFDIDKWVHLNCALWSDGVYETVNGGLMNLDSALQASCHQMCALCNKLGATLKCFKSRCTNIYHLACAVKERCVFYKNKTMNCSTHASKFDKENVLTSLNVLRRVYVERDEPRQVAAVMHHSELSHLIRVGSLTFLNVGQLLPHQLQSFHTADYIYPIGYKIIRVYWSMKFAKKRCRYLCSITELEGIPEFRIIVQDSGDEEMEFKGHTPNAAWQPIIQAISNIRRRKGLVQLFPSFITGEDLFGLTEPVVVRILESLPGVETLTDYKFKYGRNPLLELPLAINPSGSARTEPKQKHAIGYRKPHTQRTGSTFQRISLPATQSVAGEVTCPYSKQFVHSKSSQYKKMKQEWRNNVYLARSKIQGLGLYAARDLEKHTMIIEYIGEVIRTEVSEIREKQYEARNRGIYMFRLDGERVVDATLSGGLARYINHSCNPNCVTEIVEVDREYRIIIFAKRRIHRGEELSYDYKFDIEDDANKISCMCGAPNCRKWMN